MISEWGLQDCKGGLIYHDEPILMPPKAMGETFTAAFGDRILWYPRRLFGLGGGAQKDMMAGRY